MKLSITFILFACILIISACAKICTVPPIVITSKQAEVTFASSKVPCKKVLDFSEAVKLCITAIYSDNFEIQLNNYIQDSVGMGAHANAWKNVKAKDVVKKMRSQINGEYVSTYGGPLAWFRYVFYHNIAYDGSSSGPILLNRIPLRHRNASSIANTIAHETAHRIGLAHPNSDSDLAIAYKEPPYIIGDIIENISNNLRVELSSK